MRARADLGLPTHVTLRELRAAPHPWAAAGQVVHACENPQVVQAAADRALTGPLVCLQGSPSAAGALLVVGLVADGAVVSEFRGIEARQQPPFEHVEDGRVRPAVEDVTIFVRMGEDRHRPQVDVVDPFDPIERHHVQREFGDGVAMVLRPKSAQAVLAF